MRPVLLELKTLGPAHPAAPGSTTSSDGWKGPGHRAEDQIEFNVQKADGGRAAKLPSMCWVVVTTSPPATTTSPAPSARRWRLARHGDALCLRDPKNTWPCPTRRRARGPDRLQIAAHAADLARQPPGRPLNRDGRTQPARYAFDWNKQSISPLDPETAREYHDEPCGSTSTKKPNSAQCAPKHLPDGRDQDTDEDWPDWRRAEGPGAVKAVAVVMF